jgi:hypothetical protein
MLRFLIWINYAISIPKIIGGVAAILQSWHFAAPLEDSIGKGLTYGKEHGMADLAGVNGTRKDIWVIGKPNHPGVLSWAHATGITKNGIDSAVPEMFHAKFLRSPHTNARIKINVLNLLTVSSAMIASAYAQMERKCRSKQPAMRRMQKRLRFSGCENCNKG